MAQNALAVIGPMAASIHQEKAAWELMRDQATILIRTGFLPDAIKTPEQAMAVMMKGRELGVPSMYALSNIAIVKGKPTCSAELMLALIQRDHGHQAIRVKESNNTACTVEWRQSGWNGTQTYTYTIEDAQRAGLANGDTWRKHTAAMLRARCISAVARMGFAGSIAGMYTPGELGEAVTVTEDGEVLSGEIIDIQPTTRNMPPPGTDTASMDAESSPAQTSRGDGTAPSTDSIAEEPDADDERTRFRRHFFAAAKERNITDKDKLKALCTHIFPGVESRASYTASMWADAVSWIEDQANAAALAPFKDRDWLGEIGRCTSAADLMQLAAALRDSGQGTDELRSAFRQRSDELVADQRLAKQ